MKIVVDTNILISTLITPNGVVGSLLIQELAEFELFSCYYLYVELFDKKDKIRKASKLSEKDLLELLYLIIKRINFVNESYLSQSSWQKAKELTQGVDVNDISHVALALHSQAKLWTGDKPLYQGLKSKGFHDVMNTDDLRAMLKT